MSRIHGRECRREIEREARQLPLELFESITSYDKREAIRLIRSCPKRVRRGQRTDDIRKHLFRGYVKVGTIPDGELEERFRKICSRKGKHELARIITVGAFLSFFSNTGERFQTIFLSTLSSSVEDRTKRALAFTSSQLGWPIRVLKCFLSLDPDFFLPDMPRMTFSIIERLRDVSASSH